MSEALQTFEGTVSVGGRAISNLYQVRPAQLVENSALTLGARVEAPAVGQLDSGVVQTANGLRLSSLSCINEYQASGLGEAHLSLSSLRGR